MGPGKIRLASYGSRQTASSSETVRRGMRWIPLTLEANRERRVARGLGAGTGCLARGFAWWNQALRRNRTDN